MGPAKTRATKPYVRTAVTHLRSKAMVSSDITRTPAATSRADTSLTGLGKEKIWRSREWRGVGDDAVPVRASVVMCVLPSLG